MPPVQKGRAVVIGVLWSQLGELAAPAVREAISQVRGIIDEVSTKEENLELKQQALQKIAELEAALAQRDAEIYANQTKLMVTEATGQERIQRLWRPLSALAIVGATLTILLGTLIFFPIFDVEPIENSWTVVMTLIPAVFTLLGVQIAGRSFEKRGGIDAMGDILGAKTVKDRKADRKTIRALRKAGLTPDQILVALDEGAE